MFLSERCGILVYVQRETSYGYGVVSVCVHAMNGVQTFMYTFVYIWGWISMLKKFGGRKW